MASLNTCPKCGGDVYVVDSRPRDEFIYRRRQCVQCEYRFSTIEKVVNADEVEQRRIIDGAIAQLKMIRRNLG